MCLRRALAALEMAGPGAAAAGLPLCSFDALTGRDDGKALSSLLLC